MSTTLTDIAGKARMRLRDFGRYFEVPYQAPTPSTLRLPHPVVDATTFEVFDPEGTVVSSGYALDARNGLVKFSGPHTAGVGCRGYHYIWFLNEDLEYYASITMVMHQYDRPDITLDSMSSQEVEVVALGAVVNALWALEAEFATDIDVSTPEGMMIPANQRFQQIWELLQAFTPMYHDAAQMLGVGLERIEQYSLRRTALLTNRLVPLYMPREVDNRRWPQRIHTPVPQNLQSGDEVRVAPGTLYEVPWPSGVAIAENVVP